MSRIAIIGAGISGLTSASLLQERGYEVVVYEAASEPGGLIRCHHHEGALYHKVGGHVFNSKRADVLEWFWNKFSKESEFLNATRYAVAYFNKAIDYPIENHLYQFELDTVKRVVSDLVGIAKSDFLEPQNFMEFLQRRFGMTLYDLYFKPYNEKIWKKDLSNVPLSWLDGKLPMPSFEEIMFNNIVKQKEQIMVHSSFFYPKSGGSQFLANRLAEGLNICYCAEVNRLERADSKWLIHGEHFDDVIFCGNLVDLSSMVDGILNDQDRDSIESLEFHGTTSVLCSIEENPYSWIYLPDPSYPSHRIIMTGNFSGNNNGTFERTCTLEFTDFVDRAVIDCTLKQLPFNVNYLTHHYTQYTYPIQSSSTREIVQSAREKLFAERIHLVGRFAEWEYYNMDAAMGAAIDYVRKQF